MDEIKDWELYNTQYIDEDGTVEMTIRKWEHSETLGALEFVAEISAELELLDEAARGSAEICFRTWTDVDGCPSHAVSLTCRRPATEREIRIDKAKQVRQVRDERAWLQQRLVTLLEDAERAGMTAEQIGITATDAGYSIARTED